jgi:hypothetical protein
MAVFADIKEFRLQIQDPSGAIDLIEVATVADLPLTPLRDVVYKVLSSGAYVATDKLSGALPADYLPVKLLLSDSRIGAWIDAGSVLSAIPSGLKAIIAKLGSDLEVQSTGAGAESITYTSLMDRYNYYKRMYDQAVKDFQNAAGVSTGVMVTVKNPTIAGGNV